MAELIREKLAALRAQRDESFRRVHGLAEADLRRPVEWNGITRNVQFMVRQLGNHELDHLVHVQKTLRALGRQPSEAELLLMRIQAIHGELEAILLSLSDEEATAKPEGEWSVAEIVDHLIATERRYVGQIEQAIEAPASP